MFDLPENFTIMDICIVQCAMCIPFCHFLVVHPNERKCVRARVFHAYPPIHIYASIDIDSIWFSHFNLIWQHRSTQYRKMCERVALYSIHSSAIILYSPLISGVRIVTCVHIKLKLCQSNGKLLCYISIVVKYNSMHKMCVLYVCVCVCW